MSANVPYWVATGLCAAAGLSGCWVARRRGGQTARLVGRVIALVLVADAVAFVVHPALDGDWTIRSSLPLDLCDVALVVAAAACWRPRWHLGVELTYFWGLAGTLQAVLTPDLSARFPHLEFFVFVVGHVGIVVAALYLVASLRRVPRAGSVWRVFGVSVAYTAFVGAVDTVTGANYMFLAHRPAHSSLLSALGPWPWYIVGAAVVALVLFALLDLPFRRRPGLRLRASPRAAC